MSPLKSTRWIESLLPAFALIIIAVVLVIPQVALLQETEASTPSIRGLETTTDGGYGVGALPCVGFCADVQGVITGAVDGQTVTIVVPDCTPVNFVYGQWTSGMYGVERISSGTAGVEAVEFYLDGVFLGTADVDFWDCSGFPGFPETHNFVAPTPTTTTTASTTTTTALPCTGFCADVQGVISGAVDGQTVTVVVSGCAPVNFVYGQWTSGMYGVERITADSAGVRTVMFYLDGVFLGTADVDFWDCSGFPGFPETHNFIAPTPTTTTTTTAATTTTTAAPCTGFCADIQGVIDCAVDGQTVTVVVSGCAPVNFVYGQWTSGMYGTDRIMSSSAGPQTVEFYLEGMFLGTANINFWSCGGFPGFPETHAFNCPVTTTTTTTTTNTTATTTTSSTTTATTTTATTTTATTTSPVLTTMTATTYPTPIITTTTTSQPTTTATTTTTPAGAPTTTSTPPPTPVITTSPAPSAPPTTTTAPSGGTAPTTTQGTGGEPAITTTGQSGYPITTVTATTTPKPGEVIPMPWLPWTETPLSPETSTPLPGLAFWSVMLLTPIVVAVGAFWIGKQQTGNTLLFGRRGSD